MPNVTINYQDDTSLTIEEIVKQAEINYGKLAVVEVTSSSQLPHDQIYWALQQIITKDQISLIFDKSCNYQKSLQTLKEKTIKDIIEILDQVILDNETKVEVM